MVVLAVPVMAQDRVTTIAEGDGFTFEYPEAWFVVPTETDTTSGMTVSPVKLVSDQDLSLGIGELRVSVIDYHVAGVVLFGGSMEDNRLQLSSDSEINLQIIVAYYLGKLAFADEIATGFSGIDAPQVMGLLEFEEETGAYLRSGLSDYYILPGDGDYLVIASARAGTFDDWRADVEAIARSVTVN